MGILYETVQHPFEEGVKWISDGFITEPIISRFTKTSPLLPNTNPKRVESHTTAFAVPAYGLPSASKMLITTW